MSFLGNIFGKKDAQNDSFKSLPLTIATELVPYRLYANKKSNATMRIKVANITKEELLASVTVELPNHISFDEIGMAKTKEMKLGVIKPNKEIEASVEIWGGSSTEKGEYTTYLTATVHSHDYDHIMNEVKKSVIVNVV